MAEKSFEVLLGKSLVRVSGKVGADVIEFETNDGELYRLFHYSDCCESVRVVDIAGDLSDLVGAPILMAEESSNNDDPPEHADSWTWTFYRLRTNKGDVTIRWLGESNGYYSESVSFALVTE